MLTSVENQPCRASYNQTIRKDVEETQFVHIAKDIRTRIVSVAGRYGLGTDEVEDVTQDTILKLWTMRDNLDEYKSVEALAVRMATNLSLSKLRQRRTVTIEGMSMMDERYPLPDERLETKDNEAWLNEQIAGLPAAEYHILHLRQVERKSNKEIAAILGMETTSVATILSRARHRLLEAIRKRNKQNNTTSKI